MDAFEKEWAEYVRKDDIGSGFTYDEVRRAAISASIDTARRK